MKSSKEKIDSSKADEKGMKVKPIFERDYDRESKKLFNKVAVVTGGDSGIGRAICVAFAREGAHVAIVYRKDSDDAKETKRLVEEKGTKAIIVQADISIEKNCVKIFEKVIKSFHKVDILVNNAAVQYPQTEIENITEKQLIQTFRTNIFSQFFLVQAALPHLKEGSAIINIKMKQNILSGYKGRISTRYHQSIYAKGKIGTSQSYNTGKWQLSGNYDFVTGDYVRKNFDVVTFNQDKKIIDNYWWFCFDYETGENTIDFQNVNLHFLIISEILTKILQLLSIHIQII